MKARLDMDKVAKGLGAQRRGRVEVGGGYFGAMQLRAEHDLPLKAAPAEHLDGRGRLRDRDRLHASLNRTSLFRGVELGSSARGMCELTAGAIPFADPDARSW